MTLVVNKVTEPGGIRSVRLEPETVKIILHGGREITYTKSSEYSPGIQKLYPGVAQTAQQSTQAEASK